MPKSHRLTKTVLMIVLSLAGLNPAQAADGKQKMPSESERLNTFFETVYQQTLARSPVQQSYLGIKDDYDKWDDISDQKAIEDIEMAKHHLARMKKEFDYQTLDKQTQLSYRLFEERVQREIEDHKWRHHRYLVNQMHGWQSSIPSFLINIHQIETYQDAQAYIARLKGVKHLLQQLSENLKIAERKSILPPKFVFPYVIQDIENILSGKPFDASTNDSPLLEDFRKKVSALGLPARKEKKLLNKAEHALLSAVQPAYQALKAILVAQEKIATKDDGVWKLPEGDTYYLYRLKNITTTDMSPDEIHQYGLQEVDRIHNEMREIMKKVKFEGSLDDFFKFMRNDQQFYYPPTAAGRAAYLKRSVDIINTMKTKLPDVFNTLPKADIIVKAVEPFREKSAGWAFYEQPSQDGKRPGTFYVNLYQMENNPTYSAEALAYHEGVPGHHMQIAIAQELDGVPKFRKFGESHTAYIEGWGLYSEFLPKEMGFYQDPYSDFGRLSMELWRAIRLVVDTGIHDKKWTREQAIEYHLKNTSRSKEQAIKSTERYIVMPGQATAYKIGMQKILALREHAKEKLGEQFDIREYHDVVLKNGSVPLSLMEEIVNQWIEQKLAKE